MIKNNVLSLFDGVSAGQVALNRLGIKYNNYYASEIDKHAINVTQSHFKDTIQLGDVRNIDGKSLTNIQLIMGGSPCTDFTIMGNRKGMVTSENHEVTDLETYLNLKSEGFNFHGESYLFFEYVRLWKETNAKYFFLENVANMDEKWINIISDIMGVRPLRINSSKLTAQNRDRLYWTNIPNVSVPEDKGVLLPDVIPGAVTGAGVRGVPVKGKVKPDGRFYYEGKYTYRKDNKANCLVCGTTTAKYLSEDGNVYDLTPEHTELLQGFDKGYTNVEGVPPSKRYGLMGNSWTVDVIEHLFKGLITKKNKYNLYFR